MTAAQGALRLALGHGCWGFGLRDEQKPAGLGPTVAAYPQVVVSETMFVAVDDLGCSTLLPARASEIVVVRCGAVRCRRWHRKLS
jgi:hypothetical protein